MRREIITAKAMFDQQKQSGSLSITCMLAIAGNKGYIVKPSTVIELTKDLKGLFLLHTGNSRV